MFFGQLFRVVVVDKIQGVLGRGVAPPLADLPDKVSDSGWLNGASSVGALIVEQFLMQLGDGGSPAVAWGELTPAEVYDAIRLRIFQRSIGDRVPSKARRAQSNLLWAALQKLQDLHF